MDYIFNKDKLRQVLSDFYKSTGIAVALYDSDEREIASSPDYSDFCSCIRAKKQCVENCDISNLLHMKRVSQDRKTLSYTCHAGLMETIFPIVYEDVLIAYLQIGQFRDAEGIYSSEKKLAESAKRYGFDENELLKFYESVPVVSKEKLYSICNIMEILITSFWTSGLISRNRSMLSVKIEQYIDEHLSENIYISDICDNFFISKNSLYGLFADEFGCAVSEFITEKRLATAKKLLISSPEMNVAQIAAACGFFDYNYFIRVFKKHLGKTPLQFRKSKLEN